MKPHNIFEHKIVRLNNRINTNPVIPSKVMDWIERNMIVPAFDSKTTSVCGFCGNDINLWSKKCCHCGHKTNHIQHKRIFSDKYYISFCEVYDDVQVIRCCIVSVKYSKNTSNHFHISVSEIWRIWINEKGQSALCAKKRTGLLYFYTFCLNSEIELRTFNPSYLLLTDNSEFCPYSKFLPILLRNGLCKRIIKDVGIFSAISVLFDNRFETLVKTKNYDAFKFFVCQPSKIKYFDRFKIALRHNYIPKDMNLWTDTLQLLDALNMDSHNPYYICRENISELHDLLLRKLDKIKQRQKYAKMMEDEMKYESAFIERKSQYFNISFSNDIFDISVLDSIKEYRREGEAMHHCVYLSKYFEKPDSIILSARDKQGNRLETVELSLNTYKVIQSRGLLNKNTKFHNSIINFVEENASLFKEKELAFAM